MDYFTDLLESYSKLKKRSLKLLEADKKKNNPKKKASTETEDKGPKQKELSRDEAYTAAWAAPVMDPPSWAVIARVTKKDGTVGEVKAYKAAPKQTKDGGFEAQDAEGNVDAQKTTQNKGGYVVAANAVGNNNKATIIDGQGNKTEAFETWYEKNFAGEDKTGAVEGEVDTALAAAEDRAGSQLEAMGLDLSEGLGADLKTELSVLLGRVTKAAQLAKEMGVEDTWAQDSSTQPIGSYVTGPTPQSIERKLAQGKTATISTEWGFKTGDLVSEDNVDLLAGAMESVNDFAKFSSNEVDSSISDDACAALPFQVSKYKDKYVFHSHGDMESGIVLPGSDMFKHFEEQVNEICGEGAIQQVPVGVCSTGDDNTGRLNEYRGDSLEVTFAAASFYTSIDQMDIQTDKKDELRKRFGSYARKEILRDGQLFDEAHKWVQELEDSEVATDLDSAFIARAISDLGQLTNSPEKVHRFLSQAFSMERAVIEQIKPDMSIPVGEETGTGIVDDLKYVYQGKGAEKRAIEVAAQLNLTGDNAVETITVGELKKLNPEVVSIYQDGYGLSDDTVVYSVGSSIKSYLNEANSVAGQIKNYWRRSAIILGTESSQIASGFRKITAQRLGFDDIDVRQVQAYQRKLDNTYKTLDSVLPSNATVMKTLDGLVSQITFETVRPILEEVVGKLPKTSSIRQRVEKLFGSDGNIDLTNNRARRNFKEELSRILVNYQQKSDSNLRGKDGKLTQKARQARKHLAYTVHMVGGVMRDSAVNKKVLNPEEGDPSVLVTSHMAPIMESTLGLIDFEADDQAVDDYKKDKKGRKPRSDWDVKLWGSTTLRIEGSGGKYISLGTKRKKLAKGRSQTETTVKIGAESSKASASIDVSIPKWKETSPKVERDDNSLLVNFLKGQAQLLEQLLSNQ